MSLRLAEHDGCCLVDMLVQACNHQDWCLENKSKGIEDSSIERNING